MFDYVSASEMYKAILLYVFWRLHPYHTKQSIYDLDPTNAYLEKEIAWQRKVMRSRNGNDDFILTGA